MKKLSGFFDRRMLYMFFTVVAGVFVVTAAVQAATTISTNITTGGSINASSTVQITGAVTTWGAGTFGDAAGDVQLFPGSLQASSTAFFTGAITTYGAATFGNEATDVQLFTGILQASSTSLFTDTATFYGNMTLGDAVGDSVTANGYFTQLRIGTGTTFDQIGTVGTDELGVEGDAEIDGTLSVGTASSSALRVGADQNSTINGLIVGFCSFSNVTSFTASTTKFVHCTGATGLTTDYKVFVQATSSFESAFVIQAASSTASGIISLRVLNTDMDSNNGDTTLNGTSINFWAVR